MKKCLFKIQAKVLFQPVLSFTSPSLAGKREKIAWTKCTGKKGWVNRSS